MPTSDHTPRVSGASSSRKLLHTLLCFTEQRPTWTVADLANELGLATTSAYRYVGLLREVGLLDSAPGTGNTYRVTDLVLGLARACEAAQPPLAEVALPVMTRLRDEIGETVLVARRGGTSAYCVERVESMHPVRLQFDPGQAMDLHAGSLSRVLLSAVPRAERRRYVEGVRPGLPPERLALLSDEALDATLDAGWTQSFEEIDEGIWGCAAAIRLGDGVVAAIGTAAPVFRTDDARRDEIIALIRAAADEIAAALG
ncbi:IclR family transcriptional regulator [Nocardioides jishulii]|uniref:IclR family transcriptional regulator n=1 Tax=Nocardioides jishulii TaxID=2575440 RepID=A0A4U2YJD3_9ACTN|nr:IclR family transcriptional regulator [Nocardioides jishulii]QCX28129.1 IclR family transcriptional regulator [Nocardioides jishulii]TKI60794.1 IclR family transcriptional regulator [Nocardioides jishulii]